MMNFWVNFNRHRLFVNTIVKLWLCSRLFPGPLCLITPVGGGGVTSYNASTVVNHVMWRIICVRNASALVHSVMSSPSLMHQPRCDRVASLIALMPQSPLPATCRYSINHRRRRSDRPFLQQNKQSFQSKHAVHTFFMGKKHFNPRFTGLHYAHKSAL